MDTVRLDIRGMTCATCSGRIERVLRKQAGVASASVNLTTETATIAAKGVSLDALMKAVEKAGFEASPHSDTDSDPPRNTDALQIGVAGTLAALLMLPMFGIPLAAPVQLGLAIPAQLLAWWRFGPPALGAARHGTANMDTLVVLGTTAAFLLSLAQFPDGALYFESAATISAFVLLGKGLERRARDRASEAVRALMALRPPAASVVLKDGEVVEVPAESVGSGQTVRVRAGDRIPVDGVVISGRSAIDESLLTGESMPVERGPGDPVIGGSVNGSGLLEIRSTATGSDATLARIVALVEHAVGSKAPVQQRVDQIAAVFVPIVLVIAVLTFVAWLLSGAGLSSALLVGVSVLVVACPCALGLATPAALVAGTGAAAKAGIFVRDADALEGLATVTAVAFDKTGTLTEGRPSLQTEHDPDLLHRVASLQRSVTHPLAAAFPTDDPLPITDGQEHPGQGVAGTVGGVAMSVGSARFMQALGFDTSRFESEADALAERGLTAVWVAEEGQVRAVAGIGDPIRASAAGAIARVRALGLEPVLISGDREPVARAVAEAVGIDKVIADARPETKVEALAALQPVAMVGDGVNDAPALATARVGIAMGTGSEAAIASAPVTLLRADPALVPAAIDIGRATQRILHQNLFWAFAYNVVAIPLAALGFLTPMVAAGAMAMSSVTVVANALRLRSWRPQ